MRLAPLTAEHVWALRDVAPFMVISPEACVDIEEQGGFAAIDGDDRLLGIGGLAYARPGVATAWTVLTRGWRAHAREITARCLLELDACDYRRVEAAVRTEFDAGQRWLRRMGFHMEAFRMAKWGPDGDYSLYARVK